EQSAADEEAPDLVPAVVEDVTFPVGMKAFLGIGVLVEVRAVEVGQAMLVDGEVSRHPVEEDSYVVLVQVIDQVNQVLRPPVAAGRREEAGRLVAPRAVERMLGDRQEFDVGEAHLTNVFGELGSKLAVAEPTV